MRYYFYHAGSIPYIAGTFSNAIVEVDDVTNVVLSITPLVPVVPVAPSQQPSIPLETDVVSAIPESLESKES